MDIVCICCCRVRVDWTEIDLADDGERNVVKLNEFWNRILCMKNMFKGKHEVLK